MVTKSGEKTEYSARDIQEIISGQHNYFLSGETKDVSFRKAQLLKLKKIIVAQEKEINEALNRDFRKSAYESYITETGIVIGDIDHTIRHLNRWVRKRRVRTPLLAFPSKSCILPEPYGIALILSPWNYPFQLELAPLVGAMAAGNCAMLKPSEHAPNTSRLVAKLINDNFDRKYLHVIEGGVETAKSLLKEKFDYIFYTGGTDVGKIVAQAAAVNLTPHTLELGGKSPAIVEKDNDIKLVARRIVWGKFINAGQTCIAPDYIYAHQEIKDELVMQMGLEIKSLYGDNPFHSHDYARIINHHHFDRLNALIQDEKVVIGGDADKSERYIAPTILDNISWDDPAMAEEIFGPILPVLVFSDISEVIKEVSSRDKPLSLYIFTRNRSIRKRILLELSFGGGTVNDTVMHFMNPYLPFGGVGSSGYGSYHGKFNFDTFSHHKSIMRRGTYLDIPLRYPPYKGKMKLLKLAFKLNRSL